MKEDHQELPPAGTDILPEQEVEVQLDTTTGDEPLEPPPRLVDSSLTSIAIPSGSPRTGSPALLPTTLWRASDAVCSNSSSPIFRSGSRHTGLYTVGQEPVTSLKWRQPLSIRACFLGGFLRNHQWISAQT